MKTNRSFASSAATPTAPRFTVLFRNNRPWLMLVALVVIASGWYVAGRSRPSTPAAAVATTSAQLSQAAYILTLPRQIQEQVASGGRSTAAADVPMTAAQVSQSAYLLTLPAQIQGQVAGRVSSWAAASPAQQAAYIQTLPQQIQDQVRQTLAAHSR